jgi:hypothetical protein
VNPDDAPRIVWAAVVLVFVVVLVVSVFAKRRGGRGGPGAGAYGAVYDLLNEDKRNAIEMIVEDKAGYRDPEDAEGKPKAGK